MVGRYLQHPHTGGREHPQLSPTPGQPRPRSSIPLAAASLGAGAKAARLPGHHPISKAHLPPDMEHQGVEGPMA